MVDIVIDHVTRLFGSLKAVNDLDIRFESGEVTCLLGPSGCGKTTLMRMIAGLESPSSGRILFGDKDVTRIPTRDRNVGMVFQYPVMYPTLSVAENIEEPLKHDRNIDRAERARRVDEMLDVLDMRDRRHAMMGELSAGLRQKVAVGRSVARYASVVLFDEPTTNVEINAKLQLIRAFKTITRRLKQTIVYVTHDQTEAMTLGDHIALMDAGRIVQYERPRTLYSEPATRFAGWFLGNPGMNYFPAVRDGAAVGSPLLPEPVTLPDAVDGELVFGVRPERTELFADPVPGSVAAQVIDRVISSAGRELITVEAEGNTLKVKRPLGAASLGTGAIHLSIPRAHLFLFADGVRVPLNGSV